MERASVLLLLIDFEGHPALGDYALNETRFSKLKEFIFPTSSDIERMEPLVIVSSHTYLRGESKKIRTLEDMVKQEIKEDRSHIKWITIDPQAKHTIQDILNMIKKLPVSPKIRKNKPTTPILSGGSNTAGCIADTRPYSAVNLAKEGYYTQILLPMCADYQVKGVTTADKHMQAFSSLYNRIKFNNEAIKYIDIGMEPKI